MEKLVVILAWLAILAQNPTPPLWMFMFYLMMSAGILWLVIRG